MLKLLVGYEKKKKLKCVLVFMLYIYNDIMNNVYVYEIWKVYVNFIFYVNYIFNNFVINLLKVSYINFSDVVMIWKNKFWLSMFWL